MSANDLMRNFVNRLYIGFGTVWLLIAGLAVLLVLFILIAPEMSLRLFESGDTKKLRATGQKIVNANLIGDAPHMLVASVEKVGGECRPSEHLKNCAISKLDISGQIVCHISSDDAWNEAYTLELWGNFEKCALTEQVSWRMLGD